MGIKKVHVSYRGNPIGTHEVFGTDIECMMATARMFGITLGSPSVICEGITVVSYEAREYSYVIERDGL